MKILKPACILPSKNVSSSLKLDLFLVVISSCTICLMISRSFSLTSTRTSVNSTPPLYTWHDVCLTLYEWKTFCYNWDTCSRFLCVYSCVFPGYFSCGILDHKLCRCMKTSLKEKKTFESFSKNSSFFWYDTDSGLYRSFSRTEPKFIHVFFQVIFHVESLTTIDSVFAKRVLTY